ncbi:MAG: GntR family transcriptional regulator [Candidatus Delongbacteria bacterium]|nr:GntR family transcriptional regulator [Candidatus Delongbacteria bacterium]MBN2834389.1 GntR family transcriptional regulator [Candidatus Delongbacteria bacterium]
MISRESSIPMYYQIYKILKHDIEHKIYQENTKLPPEREMAALFDVTRETIRKSLRRLQERGFIYTVKGQGNFVTKREFVKYSLGKDKNFTDNIINIGMNPETRLISFEKIINDENLANTFETDISDEIWEIVRVRYADDTPVSLTKSYIPVKYAVDLDQKLGYYPSITEVLRKVYKLSSIKDTSEIEIRFPEKEDIKHLKVKKNYPLINVTSVNKMANGKSLELCTTNFRTDKIKITVKY